MLYHGQLVTVDTETYTYQLNYEVANTFNLYFENAQSILTSTIQLSPLNIPMNKTINVRINNINANIIKFNQNIIINNSENGIYNILFKNSYGNIVLYGTKIEEFN